MHKGRKTSKRIFVSLLAAALVMSTVEGSAFSVSATQLETAVAESRTAETKETETETETATEAETVAAAEETVETEVSTETEEDTTEEAGETETGTEEAVEMETEIETETKEADETATENETSVETEAVVETETEETTENNSTVMETQPASEEDYGEPLASGNCGTSVEWAVYDSNADGDTTVDTGDLLVISGSGKMQDFSAVWDDTSELYIVNYGWKDYVISLKQVKVESGVTGIGNYAFYNCSGLTSIELPVGVTSIGNYAFSYCSSLTGIELPAGLTSIGECVFESCSSLTAIELPKGVTSIEYCAFYQCSSLASVELPFGLTNIGNSAFEGCTSLTSIELPESVISIGNFAFAGCSGLVGIELPDSVTSIGSSVFFACSSLASVELPENVTSIRKWIFANCISLEHIEFPDSVTCIEMDAFKGCSNLKSIELPDSVTSIESYAFYQCTGLERVELSAELTNIGWSAFGFCDSLTSIEFPDGMTTIASMVFYNCSNLTSIKIPKTVTSIGSNACFGTNSELKVYTQSSEWCENYGGTGWGNKTAELIRPYSISCQQGETETLITEVYADGNRSYTFKEGDLPEGYMWCDESYNNGWGIYVQSGITIENIRDDITLVQADMDGFYITAVPEHTYNCKALKPEPAVYDCSNGKRLEQGKDYTITYKNNVNAYTLTAGEKSFDYKKAPQFVIKGKGDYDKTLTVYFTIQPKDIGDKDVITNDMLVEYTGAVQKKVPVVTYNNKKLSGAAKPATGQTLKNSKDFVYSYPALDAYKTKKKAYKEIGTYEILVEGTGNFTGSRTVNLTVINKGTDFTKATVKKIPAQTYTGKAITLTESQLVVTAKVNGKKVTLQQDTDYSVSYKNNKNVGTATVTITGIGDYTGTKTATFQIKGTSLAKAQVSGLENKVYNGEAQTQELTLKLSGKTVSGNETVKTETVLKEGKDYTVSYDKNVNVGTAKVTITGKGGYTGTIKKTFKITAYSFDGETDAEGNLKEGSSLTETNGLLSMKDGELSVKYVKGGCQPAVQLVFKGKTLTAGKDYTLSYSKNKAVSTLKPGDEGYKEKNAPTITIKGKGNFTGSIKKTFQITGKNLDDSESPVTITVADKAATNKKGGYISKPVLTDKDGKVLKEGTDYEKPEYTIVVADGDSKEETPLDPKDTVAAGAEVTVKVKGKGAYTGELTETYRITEKDFGKVKVQSIQKDYTGKEVTLSEADFAIADGTGKGTSKVTFGSGKDKVELEYGKDFKIVEGSYKNNIKKGTASVTLEGLGEYGGTKTIKFKIGVRGFFWWLFK